MSNQVIPTFALVIIGGLLVGAILYVDMTIPIEPFDFNFINITTSANTLLGETPEVSTCSVQEPPFFKTFPEEINWYTQCEPTLYIEETNCDKLVQKYRQSDPDGKVNYAFRILELCEI